MTPAWQTCRLKSDALCTSPALILSKELYRANSAGISFGSPVLVSKVVEVRTDMFVLNACMCTACTHYTSLYLYEYMNLCMNINMKANRNRTYIFTCAHTNTAYSIMF